jgi:hypothetical protein
MDSAISGVTCSFEELQIDNDWVELHKKISEERAIKGWTISEFLLMCGLDSDRSYFKQLCCKSGYKLRPSTKKGTAGRQLRDAVIAYFVDGMKTPADPDHHQSLENILSDWCRDNCDLLKRQCISSIRLSWELPGGIDLCVYPQCKLSDEEILSTLMSDPNIERVSKAFGSSLNVATRTESRLLSLLSPLC